MQNLKRWINIASIVLVVIGVALLGLNFAYGGKVNFALPMVFFLLGGLTLILTFVFLKRWKWPVFLFIPTGIFLAFGIIFLLNVTTGDWNSWAYAWLLLVSGAGLGLFYAARFGHWREDFSLIALGMIAGGLILCLAFGIIAGGTVILILGPVLVVLSGVALRWVHWDTILPESVLKRLGMAKTDAGVQPQQQQPTASSAGTAQDGLFEPLSSRELEVLGLIDRGLSNQEIAQKLTLAVSTVKTHINNIYGKMGVETRLQAVNRARELGLLPANPESGK